MNVHAPAPSKTNDNDADEADDEDEEDKEPISPERECSPSPGEPPKVEVAPLILDCQPTIWIMDNVTQKGPIQELILHPIKPRHRIHPDDPNLHHDFHAYLDQLLADRLPPPMKVLINWDAFCNLNNQPGPMPHYLFPVPQEGSQ